MHTNFYRLQGGLHCIVCCVLLVPEGNGCWLVLWMHNAVLNLHDPNLTISHFPKERLHSFHSSIWEQAQGSSWHLNLQSRLVPCMSIPNFILMFWCSRSDHITRKEKKKEFFRRVTHSLGDYLMPPPQPPPQGCTSNFCSSQLAYHYTRKLMGMRFKADERKHSCTQLVIYSQNSPLQDVAIVANFYDVRAWPKC